MTTSPDPHATDAMAGPHGAGDHGDEHGHDDHAHGGDAPLGPVDVMAWAAGAVGIAAGLIVFFALAAATGGLG
ncbi:MAG TPA: hypothetical protein VFX65_04950 [Candidatus Limnocylindrales bacterium]|nr:hypothetical protein [Candidatus Limnocylindrales bacterium]